MRRYLLFILFFICCQLGKADTGVEGMVQNKFQYYFLEAVCQQEKGNFAEAFELLEQCRKINPESAEVWYMLSRYYYNMKDATKARMAMEKAGELAPKNDYYLEMIAEFCIQNKENDKAIAAFKKIYENDHERGDVLERLVQLGAMSSDYDVVLWALDRLEVLEGKSERLSMTKYRILLEQKKDDEALQELQGLANKYYNDLNYKVLLGDYYAQHDKDDEALNIYNEVLAQEPANITAQSSLYRYYLAKGNQEEAYRMAQEMVNNKSLKPEGKAQIIGWAIGENAKSGKDSTENIRLFRSILAKPQEDAYIQLIYAHYLESINMAADSVIPEYEKVLAVEPDNEAATQRLIGMAWDGKDFDRVIKL
ncbi:MAG: tetratricopeptide repeat protein, partial [Prevotellaceae bacterium]|nr:tetratricopeptide repeat protein [Prevotellaceae bacterium]